MTNPEIPEEAVEAAADKRLEQYGLEYDSTHLTWRDFAGEAREILTAALPHLRVQETLTFEQLLADPGEQFDKRSEILASIDAYSKAVSSTASAVPKPTVGGYATTGGGTFSASASTPHPRPVVDREALLRLLKLHGVTSGRSYTRQELSAYRSDLATAILALLPTEEGEGPVCNCYPGGFSPETYEGPQHHCPEHGHGTDLPMSECPTCLHERALAETATKLGYELGRKEAGEQIATKIESALMGLLTGLEARSAAAAIARVVTSQPSGAAPEPRTAPDGHSDLSPGLEGREIDDEDRADLAEILGAGMTRRLLERPSPTADLPEDSERPLAQVQTGPTTWECTCPEGPWNRPKEDS